MAADFYAYQLNLKPLGLQYMEISEQHLRELVTIYEAEFDEAISPRGASNGIKPRASLHPVVPPLPKEEDRLAAHAVSQQHQRVRAPCQTQNHFVLSKSSVTGR